MSIRPTSRRETFSGPGGSALILTVVLTSLLAIVGVLFLMATRLDKMATSATAEHRQLAFAADTILAEISEALAEDVPGASTGQEYYDFPDANNLWLADLEPYGDPNGPFYWRQISDVLGALTGRKRDVRIRVIAEHDPIVIDANTAETNADADGDGVGDARWFVVPGVMSSRGKPIYAAVRIIDNGGMLNVNAGYKFRWNDNDRSKVNGDSQFQVNLLALAGRLGYPPTIQDEAALLASRARGLPAGAAADLAAYAVEVLWQFEWPGSNYTPFDLSDELELRYRYLLNHEGIDTRVENWGDFRRNTLSTPVDSGGAKQTAWFTRATAMLDPNYAYRHIATTHNLDRIIMPEPITTGTGTQPGRMVNVNSADEYALGQAVGAALSQTGRSRATIPDPAQLVANLLDYIDDDSEVTVLAGATTTSQYYGFEQPCIYISELACRLVPDPDTGQIHRSYAVELYKPYFEDRDPLPGEWKLVVDNLVDADIDLPIVWSGIRRFHVLLAENARASLQSGHVAFSDPEEPVDTMPRFGYNRNNYSSPTAQTLDAVGFREGATIELQRKVGLAGTWIPVDRVRVPAGWQTPDGEAHSLQRDISPHKCIRRLWATAAEVSVPGLGNANAPRSFVHRDARQVQAHPANRPLMNIGELGMVFAWSAYNIPEQSPPTAASLLIDLANPIFARLFNYLTVMDPVERNGRLPSGETRVKGRININTAPALVLAQLPWMQYRYNPAAQIVEETLERAVKTVAFRDQYGPFKSTVELMRVPEFQGLATDGVSNQFGVPPGGPDLTPDKAVDDFEERDLVFTRMSDLITVRSDVFTAYVLVRIGTDGAQKRIVAIFDRSRVRSSSDPVSILAVQQTPDPW